MFDDAIAWLLFIAAVVLGGWVAGIVGLVRASRALREVAALRATLAAVQGAAPAVTAAPAAAAAEAPSPWLRLQPPPGPEPEPEPEPEPATLAPPGPAPSPPPPRKPFDLEQVLTARWGVWLGAAALLLAGVFLVRYAAEEGLLGPGVRCLGMAALGLALLGAGLRLARRPVAGLPYADQVPGALAAGGVVILFAAAYAAGPLYGLVPPLAGFVLMAAAALTGLLASLRLGPLVAAIGIAGAFVTPALVQAADPSLPGLFAYLLFVAAASLAVVRYAAWTWLGWATMAAGAAWVVLAALIAPAQDAWAPALFVPALAALHLVLLPGAALDHPVGRRLAWVPVAVLGAAGLLLALAVPGMEARAGVLLLAPATLGRAMAGWKDRDDRLAALPWTAAALALALLALWFLPPWSPTGEAVFADDRLLAVLPGDWTPAALRPFLLTALGLAAAYAAAGLFAERRVPPPPLHWPAYVAAVPVLTLALCHARVRGFQPDAAWAAAALGLGAALTGTAALAARTGGTQRAGVHAAGAVAALALCFAMLLRAQWLTIALVLLLPALLRIEARADLPPLRRVALAVAGVALARLLLNGAVLDYAEGQPAFWNGRALAYLVAAASFAASARMAARRAEDRLVAVLESGACAFLTALVALEIRQAATGGLPRTEALSFTEAGLQVAALGTLAVASLWLNRRAGRPALGWVWRVQGGLALLGGAWLLLVNPMLLGEHRVLGPPLLDSLLPAYALPAVLAVLALRLAQPGLWLRRILAAYALLAAFAWTTLEVRHVAHPGGVDLEVAPVLDGELWAWSGAWMALAVALMAAGMRGRVRALRLAALAVMALVTAKVFLVDMAGLTGLWRVLSFLGLGLTLIGLGRLYGRFAARTAPPPQAGE